MQVQAMNAATFHQQCRLRGKYIQGWDTENRVKFRTFLDENTVEIDGVFELTTSKDPAELLHEFDKDVLLDDATGLCESSAAILRDYMQYGVAQAIDEHCAPILEEIKTKLELPTSEYPYSKIWSNTYHHLEEKVKKLEKSTMEGIESKWKCNIVKETRDAILEVMYGIIRAWEDSLLFRLDLLIYELEDDETREDRREKLEQCFTDGQTAIKDKYNWRVRAYKEIFFYGFAKTRIHDMFLTIGDEPETSDSGEALIKPIVLPSRNELMLAGQAITRVNGLPKFLTSRLRIEPSKQIEALPAFPRKKRPRILFPQKPIEFNDHEQLVPQQLSTLRVICQSAMEFDIRDIA